MHFLMGLNESYGSIRGQILSMYPFPSINCIFSLVVLMFLLSTPQMMLHNLMPLLSRTPNINLITSLMLIPRIDPSMHIVVSLAILKISASSYMVFPPNYKKNKPSSSNTESKIVNQASTPNFVPDFHLTAKQYGQLMSLLQA